MASAALWGGSLGRAGLLGRLVRIVRDVVLGRTGGRPGRPARPNEPPHNAREAIFRGSAAPASDKTRRFHGHATASRDAAFVSAFHVPCSMGIPLARRS